MRPVLPAVLREEPQFRLLFFGQALSLLGDRMMMVALPFATISLGGSAADVGFVASAAAVPFAIFTLAGGVWADRLPRHLVMLTSDLVRLVTQLIAAVALLGGWLEIWQLAALMLVFGTADAVFQPAATGLVPQIVAPANIQPATAMRSLTMSASLVAGPIPAGILVAAAGPGWVFAIDAVTYAFSAACLLRMRPPQAPRAPVEDRLGFVDDLRVGFGEVRARAWVAAGLGGISMYHVVVLPAIFVLGPVLADREYGGAANWALVSVCFGIGSVVGGVIALRWRPERPLATAALALALSSMQAIIIGSGLPIEAIAGFEAIAGVGVTLFFTLWETTLQEQIPEASISRVSSYDYMVSVGLMPVGLAIAGPLADAVGIHTVLFGMSAFAVPLAFALLLVPEVRGLGRVTAPVAPGTP